MEHRTRQERCVDEWLASHASTLRDRGDVLALLDDVLEAMRARSERSLGVSAARMLFERMRMRVDHHAYDLDRDEAMVATRAVVVDALVILERRTRGSLTSALHAVLTAKDPRRTRHVACTRVGRSQLERGST